MEYPYQKLSRNVRELTIASFVTKPLGIINAAILLSCLSLHEFGLFALAQSIFTLINYFAGFGQGEMVVSRYAQLREEGNEDQGLALFHSYWVLATLGIVSSTGIAFFSVYVFSQIQEVTFLVLIVGGCVALLNPLRNFVFFYFQARENFRSLKNLELSCRLLLTLAYIVLVFGMGIGLLGVLMANAIAFTTPLIVAGSSFFMDIFRAFRKPKLGPMWSIIKSQGKWLSGRWGVTRGQSSVRPWLILSILGIEAVALFDAAKTVLGICKDVVPIKKVLLPMMSREVLYDIRFPKLFQQSSCYAAWIYAALATFIVLSAPIVFTVVFPKYQGATVLVQVMSMNLFLLGFAVPQPSLFFALEKQKGYFFTVVLYLVVETALGVIGMFMLGVIGMGIGFVVSNLLVAWVRYLYLRRQDPRLQLHLKDFLKFDKDDRKFFWGLISVPKRA